MARFPQVQEKIYEEIQSVVGIDGEVTPHNLAKLHYLKEPTDPTQVEEDDNDGKRLKHIQQCVVDQKLVSEYRFGQVGREVLQ